MAINPDTGLEDDYQPPTDYVSPPPSGSNRLVWQSTDPNAANYYDSRYYNLDANGQPVKNSVPIPPPTGTTLPGNPDTRNNPSLPGGPINVYNPPPGAPAPTPPKPATDPTKTDTTKKTTTNPFANSNLATDPRFNDITMPPFVAPTPQALPDVPTFTPPAYTPPPAFSYQDFKAPTYQDARNDPGYIFGEKQGEDALSRHYAANGQGDSSTFYKGLVDYGRAAADQQYGDVFNRAVTTYGTGRANAVDIYDRNYNTQYKDPYAIDYQGLKDQFAPKQVGYTTNAANTQFNNSLGNTNAWNSYLQDYLLKHNNQSDAWSRLFNTMTA